jgi:hypothetical protein
MKRKVNDSPYDAGGAVRDYLRSQREAREKLHADWKKSVRQMQRYGFAWADGHNTLFKFCSLVGERKNFVRDMVEHSRLYFSSPSQFNDPLDCAPVLQWAKDPNDADFLAEITADEERLMRESGDSQEEIARKKREVGVPVREVGHAATISTRKQLHVETRVFCLSAKQDHPLLWSHYADSHRGVCLHFDASDNNTVLGKARAVRYRKKREPILMPLRYNKPQRKVIEAMAWRKASFWSYEHEYRIVCKGTDDLMTKLNANFYTFEPTLLTGVTLGMNISIQDRSDLIRWAADHRPKLPVYQAAEDLSRFWMDIGRVR